MRRLRFWLLLLPLSFATVLAQAVRAEESAQTVDCSRVEGGAINGISVESIADECVRNTYSPLCRLLGRRDTRPRSLHQVANYLEMIAPGYQGAPTSQQAWADAVAQDYDMFIADYYSGHCAFDPADVHRFQDGRRPRGRLAIAYVDAGEFMRCCSNIDLAEQSTWFDANGNPTSSAPAWLGPENPKFRGLYVARVWMPAWRDHVLHEIDKMMVLGYDGVFLDVLYDDGAWGPNGFAAGQAGIADYQQALVDNAKAIWDHVKASQHPDFILLGNFSGAFDDDEPALTEGPKYDDGFMRESFYYYQGQPKYKYVDGKKVVTPIAEYFAQEYTLFLGTMTRLHRVMLMQDYDLTFAQQSDMLKQSAIYNLLELTTQQPIDLVFDDRLASCIRNVGCRTLDPTTKQCTLFPHDASLGPIDIDTRYCRMDTPPDPQGEEP
jgi:uncharacterized protein (TIGR01370 family)